MIDRFGRHVHSPFLHAAVAATFVVINLAGYAFLGGRDFVEGWGGGLAAVIATGFLVWKSQGYWAWMIVNAGLWCALFFSSGLPLLGWLRVSFLAFAAYGMLQWALVKWRIGWNPRVRQVRDLAQRAIPFVTLTGPVEQRVQQVRDALGVS